MSAFRQTQNRSYMLIAMSFTGALLFFTFSNLSGKCLPGEKNVFNEISDTSQTRIPDTLKAYKLPEDVRRNLSVADQKPDENTNTTHISAGSAIEKGNSTGGKAVMAQQNAPPVQSEPRLLYEVVPSGGENKFNGKLELSLKIGEDGRVVDYRVISDSLDCTDCLNEIIETAYKSKWEPAIIDGKKTVFWVAKSYAFN